MHSNTLLTTSPNALNMFRTLNNTTETEIPYQQTNLQVLEGGVLWWQSTLERVFPNNQFLHTHVCGRSDQQDGRFGTWEFGPSFTRLVMHEQTRICVLANDRV